MKTLRTILRAFVFGAVAGVLIAPRAGSETRKMIQDRWNAFLDSGPGMSFDEGGSNSGGSAA